MINNRIANGPALDLSVHEDRRLDLSLVQLESLTALQNDNSGPGSSAFFSGLAFGAAVAGGLLATAAIT